MNIAEMFAKHSIDYHGNGKMLKNIENYLTNFEKIVNFEFIIGVRGTFSAGKLISLVNNIFMGRFYGFTISTLFSNELLLDCIYYDKFIFSLNSFLLNSIKQYKNFKNSQGSSLSF